MPNRESDFDDVVELLAHGELSVGTSATPAHVGGSPASGVEFIAVFNDSNNSVYYGDASVTVTGSTRGVPIFKNQWGFIPATPGAIIYFIAAATESIILQEYGYA
jgi:hypothetical protein